MPLSRLGLVAALLVSACGGEPAGGDAGPPGPDGGRADASDLRDDAGGDDAGSPGVDAAPLPGDDGGPLPDAGPMGSDGGPTPADGGTDAGVGTPCSPPGSTETVACGMCGSRTRFCASTGVWEDGPCTGEGACAPGATRSSPCGMCGTLEERCLTSCEWMATGACAGEGECAPDETLTTPDGCPADQTRELRCSASCVFEEVSACAGEPCDPPGTLETVPCGSRCGTRDRFCTAGGLWSYGACMNEGECDPGTSDTQPCGLCGTQARRCTSECAWLDNGGCTGERACPPPDPSCVDATTLRVFEVAGCAADTCMFGHRDVPCASCSGGVCTTGGIITGLGGPADFGAGTVPVSDDDSSGPVSITTPFPTGLNFYGTLYSTIYVNTNGNVSLGAEHRTYTPTAFPSSSEPLIAPWFGDVDTRGGGRPAQNNVHWHVDAGRVIATWHLVGYYSMHDDLQNTFQVVITERSDVAPGDFDVDFRYGACAWTTGDASGGTGGLGGTPARAGFDAGDATNGLELPGSGTGAVLDLCTTSNVGIAGVHSYSFRSGVPL